MRMIRGSRWRTAVIRLGLVESALLLTSCQFVTPRAAPSARLFSTQPGGAGTAGAASTTSNAPAVTYPVKRTTLRQTLTFSGKVVPARSAPHTFRGSGTVSTVDVTAGQSVKAG